MFVVRVKQECEGRFVLGTGTCMDLTMEKKEAVTEELHSALAQTPSSACTVSGACGITLSTLAGQPKWGPCSMFHGAASEATNAAVLFISRHTSIFFLESYKEQALLKRADKPTPNRKLLTSAALLKAQGQHRWVHRTVLEMIFKLQAFTLDCPNFTGSILCCILDPPAVCSSASAYPVCLRTSILCLIEFLLWKDLLLWKRSLLPPEHPRYVEH